MNSIDRIEIVNEFVRENQFIKDIFEKLYLNNHKVFCEVCRVASKDREIALFDTTNSNGIEIEKSLLASDNDISQFIVNNESNIIHYFSNREWFNFLYDNTPENTMLIMENILVDVSQKFVEYAKDKGLYA